MAEDAAFGTFGSRLNWGEAGEGATPDRVCGGFARGGTAVGNAVLGAGANAGRPPGGIMRDSTSPSGLCGAGAFCAGTEDVGAGALLNSICGSSWSSSNVLLAAGLGAAMAGRDG